MEAAGENAPKGAGKKKIPRLVWIKPKKKLSMLLRLPLS